MPPVELMGRHQKAIYWPATATRNRYGQQIVSVTLRKELQVRWDDMTLKENLSPDSTKKTRTATVIVDRELAMRSLMWLGSEDDLPAGGIPTSDLLEITEDLSDQDIKGRVTKWAYGLSRYTDTLPVS
jgi:hypothetical protein